MYTDTGLLINIKSLNLEQHLFSPIIIKNLIYKGS